MFVTGFCLNIVANVSNEIRAYLKNEENEEYFHIIMLEVKDSYAVMQRSKIVSLSYYFFLGISGLSLELRLVFNH